MKLTIDQVIRITKSAFSSVLNPGKAKDPLPKKESAKYPEIYVFRHGESYDNKRRLFSGWRDSKLTTRGISQAKILAQKLKDKQIDICIVSRLSRSQKTAKVALKGKKVSFEVDDRIIERNYGKLTGKSKEKMMRNDFVDAVKYRRFFDFPPPGGESLKDVQGRVFPFCRELVERVRKTGKNIAISCHGNSMKIIRLYFEKLNVVDVLIQENPLGEDFAEYVVSPKDVLVSKQPKEVKPKK
jgi:2,3-bisphosphoglycerate-dependent phosphoglycerate mutase